MIITDRDGMVPGDLVRVEKLDYHGYPACGPTPTACHRGKTVFMFLGCSPNWILTHPVDSAVLPAIVHWRNDQSRRLVPAGKEEP